MQCLQGQGCYSWPVCVDKTLAPSEFGTKRVHVTIVPVEVAVRGVGAGEGGGDGDGKGGKCSVAEAREGGESEVSAA